MGCGCRGSRAGRTSLPNEVLGYEYISPAGETTRSNVGDQPLSLAEARTKQRAHGGGTIKAIRRSSVSR